VGKNVAVRKKCPSVGKSLVARKEKQILIFQSTPCDSRSWKALKEV